MQQAANIAFSPEETLNSCKYVFRRLLDDSIKAIDTTLLLLHEEGLEHEHIELQLAHSKEDKVSGACNYAKYPEQRMTMMYAWADALDRLR